MSKINKHSDYLNYMYNEYKKNPDWFSDINNVNLSTELYKEDLNNNKLSDTKHFELLRLIINYIIDHENNIHYLLFLKSLLFSLLEENGISLIYTVPSHTDLNNKLFKLDRLYRHYAPKDEKGENRLFYHPGKGITISNTQIYFLIDAILKKDRISNNKSRSRLRSRSRSRSPNTIKGGRKKNNKFKSRKKNINY